MSIHAWHAYEVYIGTWHHVTARWLPSTCPMQHDHSPDDFHSRAKQLTFIYKLDNGPTGNRQMVFNQFQRYSSDLGRSGQSNVIVVGPTQGIQVGIAAVTLSQQKSNQANIIAITLSQQKLGQASIVAVTLLQQKSHDITGVVFTRLPIVIHYLNHIVKTINGFDFDSNPVKLMRNEFRVSFQ